MGGKASLLLVLGFSLIFLVAGRNFGNLSLNAITNLSDYYNDVKAHNLAVSGANMAANEVFMDEYWDDGINNLSFDGGIINVYVDNPLVGSGGKVAVCHIPPGNPANKHTIWISSSAVAAHLAHGDYLGDCSAGAGGANTVTIVAEGIFENESQMVVVELQPSKFSKFAYFSHIEPSNIWWTNTDTVWGPFHTNGWLRCYRHPVFYGKVTIKSNIKYYQKKSWDEPKLYGGFEKGIEIQIPTDGVSNLDAAAAAGGHVFDGEDDVYLEFAQDSLRYKFHPDSTYTTVYTDSLTNNGVIFARDAALHVKGEVKGQYSIGCSGTAGDNGTVYLDSSITYSDDPRTNPNSTDLLGIIAKDNVYIADNTANSSGDIDIHASVYCETGGFGCENYSSRPPAGNINLLGGIIQYTRRAVGTFGGSGIISGFSKRYRYDERLMLISPPSYPGTGSYEIVSWRE